MATASPLIGINIQFGKDRITLYPGKNDNIGTVIARAKEKLNLPRDRRFTLLHQGNRIRDDVPVEVAIANRTTVLFLQITSEEQVRKTTLELRLDAINNAQKSAKYGFCKTCGYVCEIRPIYSCAKCREKTFALDKEIDFFNPDTLCEISGVCSNHNCGNTKPIVQYVCKACENDDNTVPFLPQIRDNIHQRPCMKCGEKDDRIFLFSCSSRHSMCIECFISMCILKLELGEFKNFEGFGYSLPCPGPGPDCIRSSVADPHHFYVVDNGKEFYAKFKDLAIQKYNPPGDNIICNHCQIEVDVSKGKEVAVQQPAGTETLEATVPGSAWMFWKKLFARPQPEPAPPKTRKQVSCFKCNRQFCCVCNQIWHEGDCIKLTEEAERAAKEFTIDPIMAESSRWPADN